MYGCGRQVNYELLRRVNEPLDMDKDKDKELQIDEIYKKINIRDFFTSEIELFQKNNRVVDYLLGDQYILRISKFILDEKVKFERVKSISYVPKIHSSGEFTISGQKYYYLISDYVQGHDLWNVVQQLTDEQKDNIGVEIAKFLNELHSITDTDYDIGHYIPTIPNYKKSWKDGHVDYTKLLRNNLSEIDIELNSKNIISKSFDYIHDNISCLEHQSGAKLLHNDFHPKNIIIYKGKLAGVIDWECSQFGEADFELSHLFHWCIYPSIPENNLELLLKSVVENFSIASNVPDLGKRLTIYQLEHELNQLIWNGKSQENERVQRLNGWLNGKVESLFEKWQI